MGCYFSNFPLAPPTLSPNPAPWTISGKWGEPLRAGKNEELLLHFPAKDLQSFPGAVTCQRAPWESLEDPDSCHLSCLLEFWHVCVCRDHWPHHTWRFLKQPRLVDKEQQCDVLRKGWGNLTALFPIHWVLEIFINTISPVRRISEVRGRGSSWKLPMKSLGKWSYPSLIGFGNRAGRAKMACC